MAKSIITIGREHGSSGRLIGQKVAEALGIPFYDKELLPLIAKESGFDLLFIEETAEYSLKNSEFYSFSSLLLQSENPYANELPIGDQIQMFQAKVIRDVAEKGPCVIVGRCADHILRGRDDCLNVFIHADLEHKRDNAIRFYGIAPEKVEKQLKKRDKGRAQHYKRYTGQDWGAAKNYHLCLDSGILGVDCCTDLIIDAVKR